MQAKERLLLDLIMAEAEVVEVELLHRVVPQVAVA